MKADPIHNLQRVVKEMDYNHASFPSLLQFILKEKIWQKRYDEIAKQEITFSTFKEFAETKPIRGLGTSVEMIKGKLDLIAKDKVVPEKDRVSATESIVLLNDALNETVRPNHRPSNKDESIRNTNSNSTENSQYIQRKLKKDGSKKATQLLEKISKGEISYNQANQEMGWRKQVLQIQRDVNSMARALKKHFSDDEIQEIYELVNK